ncbi:MAG: GWxTD domain-containing protein [Candidatus Syntrophosphaera sp.]|nr:GWxTD domain-containing protein [Candidatus Syntrophosphaera sp.]
MRNIRRALPAILLCLAGGLFANQLINLHVSSQRFLDRDGNTVIHIDYQIPYGNLVFLAHKGGYFAEVDVTVDVARGDSVLFSQAIRDNIGITNKDDAGSGKSYLNRVSYMLDRESPYLFRMTATDLNSQRTAAWMFSANSLEPDAALSDLELCSRVYPDSSSYLGKFHRGKMLYQTQPSRIFDKNVSDNLSLFFEIYTAPDKLGESALLVLTVAKDSVLVLDDFIDYTPQSEVEGVTLKIPLIDLAPGKYLGSLEYQLDEVATAREFEFFVTEPRQEVNFLFTQPDDDYQLLKYFLGGSVTSDWKNYDEATKRRYVSQLWRSLANSRSMGIQDLIELVRERVEYANRYYGHFNPGWTSDMGRIHIRNGKPDEIDKDTTSDDTRYVRKDYQIWKYRGRLNAVYLFVDIQMNGNYRLVYVKNDESENSNPDYLRYLGSDFDTSILGN